MAGPAAYLYNDDHNAFHRARELQQGIHAFRPGRLPPPYAVCAERKFLLPSERTLNAWRFKVPLPKDPWWTSCLTVTCFFDGRILLSACGQAWEFKPKQSTELIAGIKGILEESDKKAA